MTKSELIHQIAQKQSQLVARDVELAVKMMFDQMAACLAGGGQIEIRGFGSFSPRFRSARVARDPKIGTPVSLSARTDVRRHAAPDPLFGTRRVDRMLRVAFTVRHRSWRYRACRLPRGRHHRARARGAACAHPLRRALWRRGDRRCGRRRRQLIGERTPSRTRCPDQHRNAHSRSPHGRRARSAGGAACSQASHGKCASRGHPQGARGEGTGDDGPVNALGLRAAVRF